MRAVVLRSVRRKRRSRNPERAAVWLAAVMARKVATSADVPDGVESGAMPGDREAFVATYGPLFEHSPWVAEDAYANGPYADRAALYDGLVEAMYAAPRERQVALVRAHPDLAGKAAIEGTLTPASRREQSSAGLDRLTPEEFEAF